MINELLSRPNIQEFLNKYPSNCWKELLADLFEIGVLNLRNSFHRDEFSRNEFFGIIKDLEYSSSGQAPAPNRPSYNNFPNTINNQFQQSNFSYPRLSSNYNYQNYVNQKYLNENISNYKLNYNYERRRKRLNYLENRATPAKMDAFYSELNDNPKKKIIKRRKKRDIMDKIFRSQQKRERDRYEIRDLKNEYIKNRREERRIKRMEKMREMQAEEDIKEEEEEKRREKEEEDYQEGYGKITKKKMKLKKMKNLINIIIIIWDMKMMKKRKKKERKAGKKNK